MRLKAIAAAGILMCVGTAVVARAQAGAADLGERLLRAPAVKAALSAARSDEPRTVADQIRICEVPAPSFKEAERAKVYAQMFRDAGLKNVRIDREGNVLGERPGQSLRPRLLFAAHLDTVFPEGTAVKVARQGNILKAPGIGDDCRGLAILLAVVRALDAARVVTPGTITFVGNVGEEGLGDLRGMRFLFLDSMKGQIDRFVSVDGAGYGITTVAVGSFRYRVAYKGPGGHSYGAFGMANPVHALGRAIARIADFQVPSEPRTTFNVGRIGGGTSVNSIAFEAWMEVDMRSADPSALQAVDARFNRAVEEALAAETDRWNNRGRLTLDKQLVGNRPAGRTAADAPIVKAAISVTRALGLPISLEEGSTDANIAMSLGIPAITVDGGGTGSGGHSLEETFDTTDSWRGTQRAVLLAMALSQR